jgi:hypothetical protein
VINIISGEFVASRQASLSHLTNFRFYVNQTTGVSQWVNPSGPAYAGQPAATPHPAYYPAAQPQYAQPAANVQTGYYPPAQQQYAQPGAPMQQGSYPPAQPQYGQQGFAPSPAAGQPAAPANTGIMGKLSNLNPKAQTALAVGGGLAAGALLEHEIDEFKDRPHFPHHGGHHNVFGTMAGLIGAAGAGVLGTKLLGGMGQSAQAAPPPPVAQPYPSPQPGAPAYPVQTPPPPAYPGQPPPPGAPSSGPGMGGLGKFAIGGAAGMAGVLAASGASNMLHHHHSQDGAPPAAGGGGGMSSFLGGTTHSGPRLIIHAAAYADQDVTYKVKGLVTPDPVISIENLNDEFGDPWPEAKRKMFSVLYQYGDRPLEVWAGR